MPRVFSTQCNQPSMSYPTPTNIARGRVRIITTATWARNLPHRGPPSRTSWLTSTSLQAFKARTRLTAQLVVRTRISIMDIHGMHPPLRSAIPFNPQNVPTAGSFSVFAAQPTSESIVLHPDAHVRSTKILDWAIMRSRSSCRRTETAGRGAGARPRHRGCSRLTGREVPSCGADMDAFCGLVPSRSYRHGDRVEGRA